MAFHHARTSGHIFEAKPICVEEAGESHEMQRLICVCLNMQAFIPVIWALQRKPYRQWMSKEPWRINSRTRAMIIWPA